MFGVLMIFKRRTNDTASSIEET